MKRWLLFFIIPIVFFNTACQKSSGKKGAVMRCIYDQSVFADACLQAVSDEGKFASFKRDPFYSLLYQGYSYEEGWASLHTIEKDYPWLITELDRFRTSDLIGTPQVYDYGKYGAFSPTTLHYVQLAGMIQEKMGKKSCGHIIQIGAGYGGLCKILHDLSLWTSYTIVDLPEHVMLARKVLEKEGITHVQFYTFDEFSSSGQYDFVVSDLSFSEFSRPLQKTMLERIVAHGRAGLILGHVFPKHFGVEPFTPDELSSYVEKKKIAAHYEMHQSKGERSNYYFLWNTNLKN